MAVFVLVHGAFRGGWYFEPLSAALRALGHEVHAPSLPGAGERAPLTAPHPGLKSWACELAQLLQGHSLRDVILVGHSQGTLAISAASERAHERIAHLVFLDGPVPRHGERGVDMLPRGPASPPPPDDRRLVLPPRPLESTPELPAALAAWLNPRLTPEALAPSMDPLQLSHPAALALPRTYFFCTGTPSGYPAEHGRLRLETEGLPYTWIEGNHDAPVSAVQNVLAALLDVARHTHRA